MRLVIALLLTLTTLLPLGDSGSLVRAHGDGCDDYETQAQAALDAPDADDELRLDLDADLDGIACPDLELGRARSVPLADELPDALIEAEVTQIVDGDTLRVRIREGDDEGDVVTVRVIGIDTPETRHPSRGSSASAPRRPSG